MDVKNTHSLAIEDISINHLLANGIVDQKIVDIILSVNRNNFLPQDYKSLGSSDAAVFINKERFVIEITTIANMLLLINKKIEKALVLGATLGYGSAVISKIAKSVIAVEEDSSLVELAKKNLDKTGISNVTVVNDKLIDNNIKDKFNLIIVEGAFREVAPQWLDSLNNEGIFIGIERDRNLSKIIKIVKVENDFVKTEHKNVATPYLPNLDGKSKFIF